MIVKKIVFSIHHFVLYKDGLKLCIGLKSLSLFKTISLDPPCVHSTFSTIPLQCMYVPHSAVNIFAVER